MRPAPVLITCLAVLPGCAAVETAVSAVDDAAVDNAAGASVPVPLRTTVHRHDLDGALRQTRTEDFDRFGRIVRWQERGGDGDHELTWVGVYLGSEAVPARAGYWSSDRGQPLHELAVSSPDGRFHDVYYADHGEKPRRQMRQYVDAAGRDVYQEYFAPASQRRYSEEIFRYDAFGNELGRTWQRLDGRARRDTRFVVTERDEHGRWTRRDVIVDGELDARDARRIEDSARTAARPPASAGPVESSDAILPVPFAPGVIATAEGENMVTFSPDGRDALFTRYGEDWQRQRLMLATFRDGAWREPEELAFGANVYNAALSADGGCVVYCRRNDAAGGPRVYLSRRSGGGDFGAPVDLTATQGLRGSYFRMVGGELWYHRDGDLFRRSIGPEDVLGEEVRLPAPVNTPDGVEFGAWVGEDADLLLFSRAVDGAPERSGLFAARRTPGGGWGQPERLPVPYGWGAVITPDGEDLVYVVDGDPCRVPVVQLGLEVP